MNYVTITQLALEFGIDKSNTRKYLLKKGFIFERKRVKEHGNQLNLVLSEAEANRARGMRVADGFELK